MRGHKRRVCGFGSTVTGLLLVFGVFHSNAYNYWAGQRAVQKFDEMNGKVQNPGAVNVKRLQDSLKKMGDQIVGNAENPTGVIVFMHGLGDTPDGWASQMQQMSGRFPHLKWILPCAEKRPVTCNGGSAMTSWMDLKDIPIAPTTPDIGKDIDRSIETIHGIIDAEVAKGISSERIVVGGFSQGGALAFASSLLYSSRLGGTVVLSGWAPPLKNLPEVLPGSPSKSAKFLVCHGESDQVVLPACGSQLAEILADCDVSLKLYPRMAHSSCPQEMEDMANFIADVLP